MKALRKSEERLAFALVAGGGVGTWDWDVAGDRVSCDARFARLYSLDPQQAAERPYRLFSTPFIRRIVHFWKNGSGTPT